MTHEDTPHRAEGVDRVANRAHEAIDTARDQAQHVAGSLKGLVHEAGEKLKGSVSSAGKTLESAAHSVRDQAPKGGVVGAAAGNVADLLERAGDYLEEQDFREVRKALEDLIRRRPIQTLLVSAGAGYLLGRRLR